jgi:hypothetical protein
MDICVEIWGAPEFAGGPWSTTWVCSDTALTKVLKPLNIVLFICFIIILFFRTLITYI